MPISSNEMKKRAFAFSNEWADAGNEEADAKEFLIQFLNIFDIARKRVATFEHRVKKLDDGDGYIDLLWKGTLLVEMKSRGKDLAKAYQQAKDYCHGLKAHEIPQIIMVCDFRHFHVYNENGERTSFTLSDLPKYLTVFDVLTGRQRRTITEQDPVNIQAAELMGSLHDKLKAIGYDGHQLELYLVRLLFILFADDTGLFEKSGFHDYILNNTRDDGADLALHLHQMFEVLNREHAQRLKNMDEDLARFPYVNGKLFEEPLPLASFDSHMRQMLLNACLLDWGKISPAIFGSLFQSVMDPKARRNLGAHYTSEKNILKVIKPLFLDELWEEFHKYRHNKNELRKLHQKISKLLFLDPACGCGNFLIITYRELRLLEMEIVAAILEGQTVTDISSYFLVDVDQFYGIEYEEFPAQIAPVAMWLMDHQMNVIASQRFGDYYVRLPLRKSATIVQGNALRMDWQSLLNKEKTVDIKAEEVNIFTLNEPELEYRRLNIYTREYHINPSTPAPKKEVWFDYIMGNPPFIGSKWMNENQRSDISFVARNVENYGVLDYVCGWYFKAAEYLKINPNCIVGYVSTNSITQGEQVYPLWTPLLAAGVIIQFAYRTFIWSNEAKGNAAVHCVIIGFSLIATKKKVIFELIENKLIRQAVSNVNPYLIDAKSILIPNRSTPICNVKKIATGNKPIDDGNYIFSKEERDEFIRKEPLAEQFMYLFLGAEEFINNKERFILYLEEVNPSVLKSMPLVMERVNAVRQFRLSSTSRPTIKLAETPTLYHTKNKPTRPFLVIPQVSSVRRKYIPIGYLQPNVICSDKLRLMNDATLYDFGILISEMHMSWMRTITGRLKSDFQYSVLNVYNNFPWPLNPTEKLKQAVEAAAQAVLDARALYPNSSLADLYDPNTMPPPLVKVHQALDKAVDLCYRPQPFPNDTKRIEYLFELYDQYTAGLFKEEKKGGRK
jgi:hypothetical protein